MWKISNVCVLQYDNILMEEAAQILEIETFIPLLLQVCHSHSLVKYLEMLYVSKAKCTICEKAHISFSYYLI